mgnify:FL=1
MNPAPARRRFLGFRGRLYVLVALSVISLSLFAVVSIYNVHDGSQQLSRVYERRVAPAAALHEMEAALKDVRFRLAGYLLDQLPAVGNLNHLEEARGAITGNWLRFKEASADRAFDDREHEFIRQMDRNLGNIDTVFASLAQGYQNVDKQALTAILEDEWPFAIHVALLKPISHMAVAQQAAVEATYELSVERGQYQIALQISILTVVIVVLTAFAGHLVTSLTRRLDKAVELANKVAAGDWSGDIEGASADEVGQLLRTVGHMRDQVHSRELRLQAVLDHSAEGIITIDEYGILGSFNPAAAAIFGYQPEEVVGRNVSMLMPSPHREAHDGYLEHYRRTGESRILNKERELDAVRKDGSVFPISLKVSEMRIEGKRTFLGLVADISERRAMLEQLQGRELRLKTILHNTAEGIITFDKWGMVEGFNQAAERLFGWEEKEVIGTSIGQLIVADAHERREGYLQHFLRNEIKQLVGHEGEMTGRHKDGSTFPMAIKISAITLEGQELYVALLADIRERKAMMQRLKSMAERDGLTGLYNRSYFQGELERVVERVRRAGESNCALFYVDLDNFKFINDTLGHAAGDQLLIQIAGILDKRARKSDLVARFGGDEFTVLVYDTTPGKATLIADSFRQQISGFVFRYEGQHVDIGCSIGMVMLGAQTRDAAEALSRADIACHLAKRGGRNRVHVFTEADAGNVETMSLDMGWSRRIKDAIEKGKFLLACQPIVHTASRKITSYEVLVRMWDDNNELIMPAGFLPSAERFGLSLDIDRWVIINAIDILVQHRKVQPDIRYSINLSPQAMSSPGIGDVIKEALDATQLDPAALVFEVTENAAISDMTAAVRLLTTLRSYGCRTALDDFGAGMSSFAYLQELPVDYVKIDGRFVKNLAANPVDQAMVRAMNDIAHALGKQTVAEFVEDEASLKLLAEFGVDYAQGYYLGRPDATIPCKLLAERAGGSVACLTPAN